MKKKLLVLSLIGALCSCGGGKTKNIFGKVFDDVCGCTFRVDNATQSDLPFLKKMIELRIAEITGKTI